jgi:inorganic pyrophosphatase
VLIEITPFDVVKYELDKVWGYLHVDRPQRSSSQSPARYGFVPQTYCGAGRLPAIPEIYPGDGDPVDMCLLSEREITHSEVIVHARLVGGLLMVDGGEADDKIVGVLENDLIWGEAREISELPPVLIELLEHYFLTYKLAPGRVNKASIEQVHGREYALRVVEAALADYEEKFR